MTELVISSSMSMCRGLLSSKKSKKVKNDKNKDLKNDKK